MGQNQTLPWAISLVSCRTSHNYHVIINVLLLGHELLVERTKEWFKETDGNLAKLSSKIAGLVSSKEWIVRASLCVWARTLLLCCHRYVYILLVKSVIICNVLITGAYPLLLDLLLKPLLVCPPMNILGYHHMPKTLS